MNDLSTPDALLWEALPDLTLNIAQTAALCGISVRQLGYWTRQSYVSAQGQGVRRTYGVEAIRRVLAIRKSMEAGASLRQSLRRIAGEPAGTAPETSSVASTPSAVLPAALSRSLITFFADNSHTRDHAGGLAVKLGWEEDDVRRAAEKLCAAGVLIGHVCQGMTIFYGPQGGVPHA